MAEVKVLLKKACSYAQAKNLVYVKQLLLVSESGEKRLALRLVNERAERVTSVTVAVELFDECGNLFCKNEVKLDISQAAVLNEPFVPERKIPVPDRTSDVVVKVISADYGNYTYRADGGAITVEYNYGEKISSDSSYADKAKYIAKAGSSGITVTRKRAKVPILVVIALFIALAFAVGAICIHLSNFIKSEKTFLYSGVEYAFENDDRSDGSNIYVVGFHGSKSRIVIPQQIEGHTVTHIADGAFKGNIALTSISFSSDIPIGVGAFEGCKNLRTVDFEHITEIGLGAFRGCSKLSSVTITPAISLISQEAFYDCKSLSSVIVKESDEPIKIGTMAFSACPNLKNVDIARKIDYSYRDGAHNWFVDSSVDRLHLVNFDVALENNTVKSLFGIPLNINATIEVGELIFDSLKSIPDYFCRNLTITSFTVKQIDKPSVGDSAFENCSALSSFNINAPVSEAGDYSFYNTALTAFDGNALKYIGCRAFAGNGKLASFTLLQNTDLAFIGAGAFEDCTALTSIVLPSGITEIPQDIFSGCTALAEVRFAIGTSISGIYSRAFSGCSALSQFTLPDNSLKFIGEGAFADCRSLKKFDITEKVTTIESEAFSGCIGFTDFVIPENVTAVGNGALAGCKSLVTLTVPFVGEKANNNGYLSYTFGAKSEYTPGDNCVPMSLKSVTVTAASSFGDYAFFGCSQIETVTLPDGLESIGISAFSGCKSIKEIDIPNGVLSIGDRAFNGCKFTELNIPDSVTEIGRSAFGGCESLTTLTVPFVGNRQDSNGYLGYTFGMGEYGVSCYSIPSSLKTVNVTQASELAENAFFHAEGLETITLPDTLENIGQKAFFCCYSLKSLVIPNSVISIGFSALEYCSALEELSLPFVGARRATESSNGIGYTLSYTFGGSIFTLPYIPPSLKKITLTDSDYIAEGAFSDGKYIEQIVIDCPLNGIAWSAFSDCYRLLEIFNYSGIEILNDTPASDIVAASVLKIHTTRDEAPLTKITSADGYRYIRDDNNNWYMIDYTVGSGEITLPSSVSAEGYTFSEYSVWQYLFFQDYGIKSVTIPAAVTEVGKYAFYGCNVLEHVVFAEGSPVTVISKCAFFSCSMLYDLTLPKELERIESYAFGYCSRLKKFYVSATMSENSISDNAFIGCERLFEIYNFSPLNIVKGSTDNGRIAENARAVHTTVFDNIDTVTVNNVHYIKLCDDGIDWWAVDYYGDGLLEIKPFTYKGDKITSIGIFPYAFRRNESISTVVISNAVSKIEERIFDGCYYITSITLVDDGGVNTEMEIQDHAFTNCVVLAEFKSEVAISSIGEWAFGSNYRLRKVEFLKDVDLICENAFNHCKSLETVVFGNIGTLGVNAFADNTSLRSASFGEVSIVGEKAFYGDTSLASVSFSEAPTMLIGKSAFENCRLTSFDYSGYISVIGENAFADNPTLLSVSLGGAGEIGANAFINCGALKSVSFAGNVDGIGQSAFDGDPITSLTFGGNVGAIGKYAFRDGKLLSLTFNGNVGSIGEAAFIYNFNLTKLEFKGTLSFIGAHAFNSIAIAELVLPDSLERIPEYAFAYNSSLHKITLPRALVSVDVNAFYGCDCILCVYNKSSYTLPSSVDLGDVLVVTDNGSKANLEYFSLTASSNEFLFVKTVDFGWYLYNVNGYGNLTVLPKSFTVNGVTAKSYKIRSNAMSQDYANILVDKSVAGINEYAFGPRSITVYYVGTAAEWNALVSHTQIADAVTVYYYSGCLHGNDGDTKWRYDDNEYPTREATTFADAEWAVTKQPTCTVEGKREATCKYCNKRYTETVKVLEHSFGVDGKCENCGITGVKITSVNIGDYTWFENQSASPFSISSSGVIKSTNKSNNSSAVFKITADRNMTVKFDIRASSEQFHDAGTVEVNGERRLDVSGTQHKEFECALSPGDVLTITYSKNGLLSMNDDCIYITEFTVLYRKEGDGNA